MTSALGPIRVNWLHASNADVPTTSKTMAATRMTYVKPRFTVTCPIRIKDVLEIHLADGEWRCSSTSGHLRRDSFFELPAGSGRCRIRERVDDDHAGHDQAEADDGRRIQPLAEDDPAHCRD